MYTCSYCGAFVDDPDVIYCPECSAYFEPGELMRRGASEDEDDMEDGAEDMKAGMDDEWGEDED